MNMPAYDARCSRCGAPFKAQIPPQSEIEMVCAKCFISQQDLSRHQFFIGLEAFLRLELGKRIEVFQVVKAKGDYNVLLQLKGEKAPVVAKVEFSSATGYDISSAVPAPMIVVITTGDSYFKYLLAEFIKRIKQFTKKSGELTINLA